MNIINKLKDAVKTIESGESLGLSTEVKIKEDGLDISVEKSVTLSNQYFIMGFYKPEASDAE